MQYGDLQRGKSSGLYWRRVLESIDRHGCLGSILLKKETGTLGDLWNEVIDGVPFTDATRVGLIIPLAGTSNFFRLKVSGSPAL